MRRHRPRAFCDSDLADQLIAYHGRYGWNDFSSDRPQTPAPCHGRNSRRSAGRPCPSFRRPHRIFGKIFTSVMAVLAPSPRPPSFPFKWCGQFRASLKSLRRQSEAMDRLRMRTGRSASPGERDFMPHFGHREWSPRALRHLVSLLPSVGCFRGGNGACWCFCL
jgi:hypothetical protein